MAVLMEQSERDRWREGNEAFVNKSVISVHSGSHAWPVKSDNVNNASPQEREGRERKMREKRKRDAAAHTPLTAVPWKERWRDGRRNETSIKRLMGQIQSKESHDKCPQLARMGQSINHEVQHLPPSLCSV